MTIDALDVLVFFGGLLLLAMAVVASDVSWRHHD